MLLTCVIFRITTCEQLVDDSGEIRTRASEETGA